MDIVHRADSSVVVHLRLVCRTGFVPFRWVTNSQTGELHAGAKTLLNIDSGSAEHAHICLMLMLACLFSSIQQEESRISPLCAHQRIIPLHYAEVTGANVS